MTTKKQAKIQKNPHREELIKSLLSDISGVKSEMDIAQKTLIWYTTMTKLITSFTVSGRHKQDMTIFLKG